ncbi:MAG: hypothetical protein GY839_09690 [candidate division Zixibacteria bacterium]|nr:hypothetical protein [candidate division Zixibacteria bacterium]
MFKQKGYRFRFMELAIAGNTSLAHFCAEKLCRDGYNISKVIIPEQVEHESYDVVDFVNLAGEFDIELINISASKEHENSIQTDLLICLEWPNNIPLSVKVNTAKVGCNLAGQFEGEYLIDIAAYIYNGNKQGEVQLLLEDAAVDSQGSDIVNYEPPFFAVLDFAEFEINQLDDLRSVKTKAASRYYRLLKKLIKKLNKNGLLPRKLNREMMFKRVKAERIVDWNRGAMYLHNLVRTCTHPGSGVYTWLDDKKLIIWRGHFFDLSDNYYESIAPGTIVDVVEELGVIVKTSHGSFLISRIRPIGSPELPAWVWASQEHILPGEAFQVYNESKIEVDMRR